MARTWADQKEREREKKKRSVIPPSAGVLVGKWLLTVMPKTGKPRPQKNKREEKKHKKNHKKQKSVIVAGVAIPVLPFVARLLPTAQYEE